MPSPYFKYSWKRQLNQNMKNIAGVKAAIQKRVNENKSINNINSDLLSNLTTYSNPDGPKKYTPIWNPSSDPNRSLNSITQNMYSSLIQPWQRDDYSNKFGPKLIDQRVPLENRLDPRVSNTNISGIEIPEYSLSKKDQRANKNYLKNLNKEGKVNLKDKVVNFVKNKNNGTDNGGYEANNFYNTIVSNLKDAPLVDSILGYYQKKRDTPDYSGLENYKYKALQETPIRRYTPTHITGNLKFNPYDYTGQANLIRAQLVAAQNLAGRSAAGNTNMLMAHMNNLLSNTNKAAGDASLNAWKANEQQRIAVAQENRRADEYNANADTNAESSYINARNAQIAADKQNELNALQYYDQQKYARNAAYQQQLDAKRDEMVKNLGTYGENAYTANEANTDQSYNYWKDRYGRLHYISGINGARPVQQNNNVASNYNKELFDMAYDSASDNEKAKMAKMTDAQKQAYLLGIIKRNNQTANA